LDLKDPESVAAFIEFWDSLVSAWNPSQNEPKATVHPSARDPSEMNYTLRDLTQLLNRFQWHTTCMPSYWLRRPKGAPKDASLVCHFQYPQECREMTEIKLDDKKRLKIFPKRNDPLLNLYNAMQILGWQANVDFSPLTSMQDTLLNTAPRRKKNPKTIIKFSIQFSTLISKLHPKSFIKSY